MKKFKSTLLIVVAMLLVAVISVTATIAYLKSQTDIVANTFTVGNVKITLDEAAVNNRGQLLDKNGAVWDSEGTVDKADRVIKNEYHLVPGRVYVKDPTVHLKAGSEAAYLFVKVAIEDDFVDTFGIEDQMTTNGWKLLDATNYPGVYVYTNGSDTVVTANAAGGADKDFPVFNGFTVSKTAEYAVLSDFLGDVIKIRAYAIQAEGFTSAAAAYAADPCNWGI